ncbi:MULTISPECIES: hypothetical protein [unclassified Mesorhizobium]|uniref:hypothetical protein n=1 Tax=unclassified Mesorhizobium TaxID=325217 RepID=UPI0003CEFEA4|nr:MULTISPECIES: hypothetical protein [unclassified Mesorhizobium]ESY22371.1 hypothetical protein X751_05455 [Mesorhizobium sp. LNJC395A00]ESZ70040.1 hypothetical protein X727_16425 [Mesorhizobium sp. L103C119B0]WJI72903.1 hypothetical protein NLY37_17880 [Mesorhizobium sp. C395A]
MVPLPAVTVIRRAGRQLWEHSPDPTVVADGGTHLSNRSSHAETLRTVSDLLHRARRVIRDGGHAAAMFEIDTLLQVAQTEVARRLERNDR